MTDLPLVADDFPSALTDAARLTDAVLGKLLVLPEGPEARVVEATNSFTRDVGIQWGTSGLGSAATGNPTGIAFPSTVGVAGGALRVGARDGRRMRNRVPRCGA